jgi:hypothetical protein
MKILQGNSLWSYLKQQKFYKIGEHVKQVLWRWGGEQLQGKGVGE